MTFNYAQLLSPYCSIDLLQRGHRPATRGKQAWKRVGAISSRSQKAANAAAVNAAAVNAAAVKLLLSKLLL